MVIEQDKCVFSQFLLSSKMCVEANKELPLLPKLEGEGQMISAFQSRYFGFGLQISEDQLSIINERCCQQNYINTVAATEVFGSIKKKSLLESLFIQSITIGVNNNGYWMPYLMAIQLEDCADCLKICFANYDFVFLLDYSQGCSKKCAGALQATNVSLYFGGKQPIRHDSEITDGCLGIFELK